MATKTDNETKENRRTFSVAQGEFSLVDQILDSMPKGTMSRFICEAIIDRYNKINDPQYDMKELQRIMQKVTQANMLQGLLQGTPSPVPMFSVPAVSMNVPVTEPLGTESTPTLQQTVQEEIAQTHKETAVASEIITEEAVTPPLAKEEALPPIVIEEEPQELIEPLKSEEDSEQTEEKTSEEPLAIQPATDISIKVGGEEKEGQIVTPKTTSRKPKGGTGKTTPKGQQKDKDNKLESVAKRFGL